jgi:hypothetical protein
MKLSELDLITRLLVALTAFMALLGRADGLHGVPASDRRRDAAARPARTDERIAARSAMRPVPPGRRSLPRRLDLPRRSLRGAREGARRSRGRELPRPRVRPRAPLSPSALPRSPRPEPGTTRLPHRQGGRRRGQEARERLRDARAQRRRARIARGVQRRRLAGDLARERAIRPLAHRLQVPFLRALPAEPSRTSGNHGRERANASVFYSTCASSASRWPRPSKSSSLAVQAPTATRRTTTSSR